MDSVQIQDQLENDKMEKILKKLKNSPKTDVLKCYQCAICSAGCPVSFAAEYTPRQLIRMIQLGFIEDVLESKMLSLCLGCSTCTTRCPRGLDLASIMNSLKINARKMGFELAEKEIESFNDNFLYFVEKYGRAFEAGLTKHFNIIPRKKEDIISHFPEKVSGIDTIKKIFDSTLEREEKQ